MVSHLVGIVCSILLVTLLVAGTLVERDVG